MNLQLIAIILICCCGSVWSDELKIERSSHPHFPDDIAHQESAYTEKTLTPAVNVKGLVEQEKWLREQLDRFPPLESRIAPPLNRFGYLSRRPLLSSGEDWIQLQLNLKKNIQVHGVALIPACYPEHSTETNYGFPKRFKVEAYTFSDPSAPISIADWTKQDFPDPGLFPVLFSVPNLKVNTVKLTVIEGARD